MAKWHSYLKFQCSGLTYLTVSTRIHSIRIVKSYCQSLSVTILLIKYKYIAVTIDILGFTIFIKGRVNYGFNVWLMAEILKR